MANISTRLFRSYGGGFELSNLVLINILSNNSLYKQEFFMLFEVFARNRPNYFYDELFRKNS